jgi:hypothetical protein
MIELGLFFFLFVITLRDYASDRYGDTCSHLNTYCMSRQLSSLSIYSLMRRQLSLVRIERRDRSIGKKKNCLTDISEFYQLNDGFDEKNIDLL